MDSGMQRCTGLDELILSVNDSRIFGCGRCVVDGCPRMEFFLDRPLIHANLSQSHSVFFARLHSANRLVFALLSQTLSGTQALRSCLWLSRFRSLAECWTRASALAFKKLKITLQIFTLLRRAPKRESSISPSGGD